MISLASALRAGTLLLACAVHVSLASGHPAAGSPDPWPGSPGSLGSPAPDGATAAAGQLVLEWSDGRLERRAVGEFKPSAAEDPALLALTFEGFVGAEPQPSAGAAQAAAEVGLVGGDRLVGQVTGGSAEELVLELAGGVTLTLSIDELEQIVFPGRLPDLAEAAPSAADVGDRLYRRTGGVLDRLDGAVLGFSAGGVSFEGLLGTREVPWGEVAALFLETFGAPPEVERPPGLPVVVDLVDGSRLRGELLDLEAEGCRLSRSGAVELLLPLSALSEVSFADGRFAFLSDLTPSAVDEGSPFGDDLGLSWPHRVDRAVDGGPLRVAGRTYGRGLGVHSPSRLTWDLDGSWDTLRLAAALDDQVLRLDARGSVEFRVLLDGEQVWTSGLHRGGDERAVLKRLSLGEARQLTLEVDMATDYHMGDRANWLRPMLVCTEARGEGEGEK